MAQTFLSVGSGDIAVPSSCANLTALAAATSEAHGPGALDLGFGGGLRCYIAPKTCLTVEYSVLHLSNGGTSASAHGINTQMITLGLSHNI